MIDAAQIDAIAEQCRKHGIRHLKTPDLELQFDALAPEPQRKFPDDYVGGDETVSGVRVITQDEIDLFGSAGTVPVNLRELRAKREDSE